MNRFERALRGRAPRQELAASLDFGAESALLIPPARDTSRALFAPLHYEPNYGYPLLVWLHGPGSDERQLTRIMPVVSMRNYVAVAPRGLPVGAVDGKQCWGWSQSVEHVREAEQRIFECIEDAEERFHIAPSRLFLAGADCGGTMAFRVAMNHPARFAGVLSFGGAFPQGQKPFGQWNEARRLAVFLAAGRDSDEYPADKACDDLRLLHSAGMSVITFRQYASLRQYSSRSELAPQVLRDVDRWIIEQITTPAEPDLSSRRRSSCPSD
jgi:phospholipase/carboxylesterase